MASGKRLQVVISAREDLAKALEVSKGAMKAVDAQAKKTAGAIGNLGRSVKKTGETVKRQAQSMRGFAVGLTAVGVAVGGALALTVKSASDLKESVNAVEVVFGDASKTIIKFGETASKTAGLSAAAFNELATTTGSLLQNFGFSAQEAADQTIVLAKRAADMASVFNTPVKDALFAVNAALRGETEPIRRFAVDVTQATLTVEALAQGITQSVESMTVQQKVALRLDAIMRQTEKTQGDFANTSGELANTVRILKSEMANMAAEIGQILIPVVQKVLTAIRPVVERIREWTKEHPKLTKIIVIGAAAFAAVAVAAGAILLILPALISGIAAFGVVFNLATGGIPLIIAGITVAVVALGAAWATNFLGIRDITATVWNFIKGIYSSWLGWLLPFGPLIKGFVFLKNNWNETIDAITKSAENFVNKLVGAFEKIRPGINKILDFFGRETITKIERVSFASDRTTDAIVKGWSKATETLQDFGPEMVKVTDALNKSGGGGGGDGGGGDDIVNTAKDLTIHTSIAARSFDDLSGSIARTQLLLRSSGKDAVSTGRAFDDLGGSIAVINQGLTDAAAVIVDFETSQRRSIRETIMQGRATSKLREAIIGLLDAGMIPTIEAFERQIITADNLILTYDTLVAKNKEIEESGVRAAEAQEAALRRQLRTMLALIDARNVTAGQLAAAAGLGPGGAGVGGGNFNFAGATPVFDPRFSDRVKGPSEGAVDAGGNPIVKKGIPDDFVGDNPPIVIQNQLFIDGRQLDITLGQVNSSQDPVA